MHNPILPAHYKCEYNDINVVFKKRKNAVLKINEKEIDLVSLSNFQESKATNAAIQEYKLDQGQKKLENFS